MSLGQDLADFLLARIAEDEDAAKAAGADLWQLLGGNVHLTGESANMPVAVGPYGSFIGPAALHMVRQQPLNVLAECTAKRKIVEELRTVSARADTEYDSGRVCAFTASLLLLADVYADHPDYDQTWRP